MDTLLGGAENLTQGEIALTTAHSHTEDRKIFLRSFGLKEDKEWESHYQRSKAKMRKRAATPSTEGGGDFLEMVVS